MRNLWVVGHRGASGHAPENTLAAFRRAIEQGAGFIETDLHLSRDGRLVAIHDATLDRTTNGRGPVNALRMDELRQLDAGSWYAPEFAGERIPTLEEILKFAREHDVVFYLEVKTGSTWGVEHALVGALRDAREPARTVVLSFEPSALANVRRLDPTLLYGFLFDDTRSDSVAEAVRVGARQLAPRRDRVTPALVAEAHAAGLQVVTWTVDEPDDMRALMDAGVDGIMTNYPDRLTALLAERKAQGG